MAIGYHLVFLPCCTCNQNDHFYLKSAEEAEARLKGGSFGCIAEALSQERRHPVRMTANYSYRSLAEFIVCFLDSVLRKQSEIRGKL